MRQSATKEGILCSYIIWSLTSTPEHEAPLRADSLGMGRRKDENKRLGVKEIDRLCRLTTTALTTIKNLLKLLSCQIREILKSLNSSGALRDIYFTSSQLSTQPNLSLHIGFLSHPSMYVLLWLCVNGRHGGASSSGRESAWPRSSLGVKRGLQCC